MASKFPTNYDFKLTILTFQFWTALDAIAFYAVPPILRHLALVFLLEQLIYDLKYNLMRIHTSSRDTR